MFVNGSGRDEYFLSRTAHRWFLPSFGSFGQAVSEEKNFKNKPIRKKSRMWRPCLLTDRDEICNRNRGLSNKHTNTWTFTGHTDSTSTQIDDRSQANEYVPLYRWCPFTKCFQVYVVFSRSLFVRLSVCPFSFCQCSDVILRFTTSVYTINIFKLLLFDKGVRGTNLSYMAKG